MDIPGMHLAWFLRERPGIQSVHDNFSRVLYCAELLSCSGNWLLHCEVVQNLFKQLGDWTRGACLPQEAEQQTLGRLPSPTETSSMFFVLYHALEVNRPRSIRLV